MAVTSVYYISQTAIIKKKYFEFKNELSKRLQISIRSGHQTHFASCFLNLIKVTLW